ncbi:MAG: glycine cleavage system aminomethyltransferase GcvT [Planctomycetes bacterium]|jgi:aminomethyltransferase|nr:glycine cleavage system aminomethyltransferase GcvT [Planctomycetota bacterium]
MQKTALESIHIALGARMVPFGGWNMPVQYRAILDEARTVRTKAGLFDLGHMGRVKVRGPQAEAFLQKLQTNDAAAIPAGRIRYAMILNEQGLTQDDILVYRNPKNDGFFVVINAGNAQRDLEIMRATAKGFDVVVEDCTQTLGMIAIQGPASEAITQRFTKGDLKALKYYAWMDAEVCGVPMTLSRTGYTGEDGFEVYVPKGHEEQVWNAFLEHGQTDGLTPIGLGARDTLRHEAGMPLYGHEIDETTNPIEAGLDWAVKMNHDFTGKAALEQVLAKGGTGRKLVGLTSTSKRCPRQGYPLVHAGQQVGHVCSGNISPTLDTNIATAYVRTDLATPGTQLEFLVRDKAEPCVIAALPFYKRQR